MLTIYRETAALKRISKLRQDRVGAEAANSSQFGGWVATNWCAPCSAAR